MPAHIIWVVPPAYCTSFSLLQAVCEEVQTTESGPKKRYVAGLVSQARPYYMERMADIQDSGTGSSMDEFGHVKPLVGEWSWYWEIRA